MGVSIWSILSTLAALALIACLRAWITGPGRRLTVFALLLAFMMTIAMAVASADG